MANRTRDQLRSEVYTRLAESGSGFYTDAQVNQWLADGVRDLSVQVEPLVSSAKTTTVSGTAEYALPTGTLSVKRALYLDSGDAWFNLRETTWETLLATNPDFENDTDDLPKEWYWRQNVIGLYPAPGATDAGTDKLRVIYTYLPDAMDEDGDTTGLEEWLDDAVILYAVYRAYLKDRAFQHAEATAQEYSRALSEATIKLNRQRKDHAPRLVPVTRSYRAWYQSRLRRTQITST